MKSKEIIEHIQSIYQTFEVPKNLQEHMLRAAAVGSILCDNWKGPAIHKEDVIAVLLIHDLGNIVKMDMDTQAGLEKNNRKIWR